MSDDRATATEASRVRIDRARELARGFALDPGQEVAITGSVARGVADRYSDIELNVYGDTPPPLAACDAAPRAAGARVDPASRTWGGKVITKSWFHGIFVEAAWQTWDNLEHQLRPLLAAESTDHWQLTQAWHVAHALPLTDTPKLAGWQEILARYPDALQARLVADATAAWAEPHWYPLSAVNAWPLVRRNARMSVAARLIREVENLLRLLFALNRQWEPDYKWLGPESARLGRKPDRLVERVNEIFATPDAARSVQLCFELILDTLRLVPAPYDVTLQIGRVRKALVPDRLLQR